MLIPDVLAGTLIGHRPPSVHPIDRVARLPEDPLVASPMTLLPAPTDRVHRRVFEQDQGVRSAISQPLLDQGPLQLPGRVIGNLIERHQHAWTLHDSLLLTRPRTSPVEPVRRAHRPEPSRGTVRGGM